MLYMIVRWQSAARLFLQMPSTARFCSSSPPPGSFIDIIDKKFRGKLIIIPTPIGNMQDISVNIYKKLFEVDVIGCEDTRVAGKLFKLIETREIANKLYNLFGFSNKEMVEYDPIQFSKDQHNDREKLFMQYSKMNEKQRRRLLSKMTLDEEKEFKKEYLVFRATKLLGHFDQFSGKKVKEEDSLYGLQNSDLSEIERHIRETRKKKGRGVMVSLNTHSQTKLYDTILKVLEDYTVGLVADAGTPCISDPGFKLVRYIRQRAPQIPIEVVMGPSSVGVMATAASVTSLHSKGASGYFEGFSKLLYQKNPTIDYKSFAIYFENAKRLPKTLAYIEHLYGPSQKLYIAGQISKRYDRRYNGRVDELRNYLGSPGSPAAPKEKLVGQISYFLYPKHSENKEDSQHKTEFDVDPVAVTNILVEQIDTKSKQVATILMKLLGMNKGQATKHVFAVKHPKK